MDKKEMLAIELEKMGYLKSPAVKRAFFAVNREEFVPHGMKKYAYVNEPLFIGYGQTISQPLTVITMTEALDVQKYDRVLEVGTGSGYQAAILCELAAEVITTEIVPELHEFAKANLEDRKNMTCILSDGSMGCEKYAPYDRIIVTASAPSVPTALIDQLKDGGKIVIPVGIEMLLIEKRDGKIKTINLGHYAFVPLKGKFGYK